MRVTLLLHFVLELAQETGLGNYLVEMGISDDHNFMAACLYHYDQLRYKPTTEVLVFEGKAAQKVVEKF